MKRGGHVYVIGNVATRAIKVGRSDDVVRRRRNLVKQLGASLRLLHVSERFDDAERVEKTAHRLLVGKHIKGEWFTASLAEAVAAIERAKRIVNDAVARERKREQQRRNRRYAINALIPGR